MAPQVPLWQDVAKPMLDAKVPDNIYDAQRDSYFQQYVLPAALKAGESPTMARENFMRASERPDKASMPRAALVGASALKALTDPLSILMDDEQAQTFRTSNKQLVKRTSEEAQRQGISPTPYALAGDLLGTAPYFVGGFGATAGLRAGAEAGLVGAGISETAAKIATEAATAGVIQGAYDAAKAQDGHRLVDGLQGAAMGTALAGGLMSAGPLAKFLLTKHALPEEVATALENTAKGVATPAEETMAANVAQAKPDIAQTIQQVVAAQVQAAKKAGLPKDAMMAEPGGRLKIALQTADGKTYNVGGVTGVDIQNIGTLVDRISPHLDAGGQVLSVSGDPLVQQKFLQSLEELNNNKGLYNVELPPDAAEHAAGVKAVVEADASGSKGSAPSPASGATPSEASAPIFGSSDSAMGAPREARSTQPTTLDEMDMLQKQFEAAQPGAQSKSLPTYDRQIVDEMAGNTIGQTFVGKGVQPRIVFDRGNLDPQVAFHETLHGLVGYTGLAQDFSTLEMIDKSWRKMVYKMTAAWPDEMRTDYFKAGNVGEEVYAYLASAIRTNDETMIQRFADADGGREGVMKWAAETTDTMLDSLAQVPDSVHKRVLERKLKEVFRRSTNSLREITGDTADVYGTSVDVLNGKYVVRTPNGDLAHFDEKEQLVNYLEKQYAEPLSTASLVDETAMPQGVPRLARAIPPYSMGKKPIETPPPTLENPGAEKLGGSLASFFFRPFYPWIDSVAKKFGRPELYDMFKGIDVKMVQRDAMIEAYEAPLKRALVGKSLLETKYPPARQQDLYMYLQAKPGFEAQTAAKFNITPKEIADIDMLRKEVLEPLANQSGIDFVKYVQDVAPLVRRTADPDLIKAGNGLTQIEADFWRKAIMKGEIDPFDQDLLRTSHSYVRLVSRGQTIGADLDAIGKMIDEKIPGEDEYRLGAMRPLLKRQLEYIKGRPDYTQRLLDGAAQQIINVINGAVGMVNDRLPGNMKIPTIDSVPQDVLGRWMLYSYAGGLALRPMVVFRDSMQLFLTTFPMLGGKYTTRGLIRAFGGVKEGTASEAWQTAERYGALMHQSDLQNLYSGSYETLAGGGKIAGKLTNFAEGSLKWLQWSNNSNRLVTFWGHAEKNLDALAKNVPGQNAKGLIKDAGWHFLDDRLRDNFVKEAMSANASQWQDIAYRAAKEMTDITQWNYRRGASPGIYKYSMGRLFGQYGTWPLNYIEYARRLATKGDPADRAAALARLAIAHGAVLKTGEMFGIDTGQWVFTQPMAYGGSPLFQAVVNVPNTMDFESYRGAEARREMARIFWPMEVPGGLAAEKIYKAINADSPTALQEALGFQPLKSGEEDKGLHSLIP